ncbi:hypothetical protein CEXT_98711 [Caerostris extrusa]|uniref:Uncharacterized protein n=1 Tax=Caerostris extrusa TaxID=172846 RepID=A0AAV4QBE1_CAEEX|nr:hypothetical protein CEXT_98711 [Caerostris extrusa]
MNRYLHALKFATDLVEYCLLWHDIPAAGKVFDKYVVPDEVQDYEECLLGAIAEIVEAQQKPLQRMFDEFKTHDKWLEPDVFGSYVLNAVPVYFPDGYTAESFLAFCATICGAMILYCKETLDCSRFFEMTANIISVVLIGHTLTGEFLDRGGWRHLNRVSEHVLDSICDRNLRERLKDVLI